MRAFRRNRGSGLALLFHLLLSRSAHIDALQPVGIISGFYGGSKNSGGQKRQRQTTTTTGPRGIILATPNSLLEQSAKRSFSRRDPSCQYHHSRHEEVDTLEVNPSSLYESAASSTGSDDDALAATTTGDSPSTTTVKPKAKRRRRRNGKTANNNNQKWDTMITKLEKFHKVHGHSLVTSDCKDQDLYRWTVSIRRNYRHQVIPAKTKRRRSPMRLLSNTTNIQIVSTSSSPKKRQQQKRPHLSVDKLRQLSDLDFCWDVQAALWDRRYEELRTYYRKNGHVLVPASHPTGLGMWVRNQRREYRKLVRHGLESSTLALDNRLERLEKLNFTWCRSHEEAWLFQYEQLQEFREKFGHSNVPEDYKDNFSLGQWCMNQRTAYKRYCAGEATAMTPDRIQKLEQLNFCWAYREQKWQVMKQRLVDYYAKHGHVRIPTNDVENQDLRTWLIMQRYYYNRRHGGQHHGVAATEGSSEKQESSIRAGLSSSPLTEDRIKSLEKDIPNFRWTAYDTGPSRKDWAKLFNAMRDKGIQPGMRPKLHWFEGTNPFSIAVKDRWTEEDLLDLWNQNDGDDEDDAHRSGVMLRKW